MEKIVSLLYKPPKEKFFSKLMKMKRQNVKHKEIVTNEAPCIRKQRTVHVLLVHSV